MKIPGLRQGQLWLLAGTLLGLLSMGQVPLALGQAEATKPVEAPRRLDRGTQITVQKGSLPVIISAPHGGSQTLPDIPDRTGQGKAKFVVVQDTGTDKLAAKLADAIEKRMMGRPYLVIAHFRRKQVDVNRPAKDAYESDAAKPIYDAYHRALEEASAEVRQQWGRGIVLDIHGQAADREAIFRGTNDGKTVLHLTTQYGKAALTGPKSILGVLAAKGYKIVPACDSEDKENASFNGGYIVQTYGSWNGGMIDAIQFETGGKQRTLNNLDQTAADIAEAVAIFAKEYLPQTKIKPESK